MGPTLLVLRQDIQQNIQEMKKIQDRLKSFGFHTTQGKWTFDVSAITRAADAQPVAGADAQPQPSTPPNDLVAVMQILQRTIANHQPEVGSSRTPNQAVLGISLRVMIMMMIMPSWNHHRGNQL
ncbi:hypothetical protein SEVIR_7G039652v4 [Setaria viridis]